MLGLQGPRLDHQARPWGGTPATTGFGGLVAPPLLTLPLVLSSLGRMFPDVQATQTRQASQPRGEEPGTSSDNTQHSR